MISVFRILRVPSIGLMSAITSHMLLMNYRRATVVWNHGILGWISRRGIVSSSFWIAYLIERFHVNE